MLILNDFLPNPFDLISPENLVKGRDALDNEEKMIGLFDFDVEGLADYHGFSAVYPFVFEKSGFFFRLTEVFGGRRLKGLER